MTEEHPRKRYPRHHPLYVRQVRRVPSKYRGVRYCLKTKAWRAKLKAFSDVVLCEYFATEIEAARAYDKAALMIHKNNAILNFPEDV